MPYAARRQPFQPNAFRSRMLAGVARRASDGQITFAVAQRYVNMFQRSRPAIKQRASVVAAGAVGKDGGHIGGCQFLSAVAPIG